MRLMILIILLAGCASPALEMTPEAAGDPTPPAPAPERIEGMVDLRLVELRAPRVDLSTGLNRNCIHFDGAVERAYINATWDDPFELELDSNAGSLGLQASPAHWRLDVPSGPLSLALQMPEIAAGDIDVHFSYTLIGSGFGDHEINDCDL